MWVCEVLVWDHACRPGTKAKTVAFAGACSLVTQAALLVEGGGDQRHYHYHR